MGFCRRCGDIVAGARCKCGGTAVAPVIAWNHSESSSTTQGQDRWSKTYTSSSTSNSASRDPTLTTLSPGTTIMPVHSTITTRRFPRPKSTSSVSLRSGVMDHISSTTAPAHRPPSPLKHASTLSSLEADILPSLNAHEPTLSKVYGSILQPKDTLPLHSCAICACIFPPDTTIYPNPQNDPSEPTSSFVCQSCFAVGGGSKGICPSCSKPVLTLKSEGGFIHSAGQYWHKRCFNCAACFKNIGDSPMVDVFGRPSCSTCFDNCLKRDPATPKKDKSNNSPKHSNPGGLNVSYGKKSRENSPALEELEQRLGVIKSRQANDTSPSRRGYTQQISNPPTPVLYPDLLTQNRRIENAPSAQPSPRSYDSKSMSDGPTNNCDDAFDVFGKLNKEDTHYRSDRIIEETDSQRGTPIKLQANPVSSKSSAITMSKSINTNNAMIEQSNPNPLSSPSFNLSASSPCAKCGAPIIKPREGGQFVTVPGPDENSVPQTYHSDCFKCAVCDHALTEARKGQLGFVKCDIGPCHANCAPKESVIIHRMINTDIIHKPTPLISTTTSPLLSPSRPISSKPSPSSRFEVPLANSPQSPTKSVFPRFGGQATCPGCRKAVSPMERGVVPGPQGTRWHASCLVCGGRKDVTTAMLLGRTRETKVKAEAGCGKKLDSAAKSDGEGGVWCRECLLLLGANGSSQSPSTRAPLSPPYTKITPQLTGMTTIAQQFTGVGSANSVLRQLTGGGLSPTRSISPTKQLGMMGTGVKARPKSVIGMSRVRGWKTDI